VCDRVFISSIMTYLLTAGPTREPLDPVRYLSNHSSGKMGYAIAKAAVKAEHRVILISGPTTIDVPDGVDFIPVETAAEMAEAVAYWISKADVAIMTAAVADFRAKEFSTQKIKKTPGQENLTIELIKNPDILKDARAVNDFQGLLVGFAAETENLIENAQSKLERKGCDLILANDVSQNVFGSDDNTLIAVYKDRVEELGTNTKERLGELIVKLCDEERS